jgi:hypothetical protein
MANTIFMDSDRHAKTLSPKIFGNLYGFLQQAGQALYGNKRVASSTLRQKASRARDA